ncbi:MAG: hypothetical protein K2X68_00430 [Novosphingobium sp.]|nr:hypothetical protein [Novosphingobium sp.]
MADPQSPLDIYQAYASDAHKALLAPIARPYDIGNNTGNSQREYELFKRIHAERPRAAGPWGLVSAKFELKTCVPLDAFHAFAATSLAAGADCAFINPMIGNEALHANVWEQWWMFKEPVTALCQFLETVAPIDAHRIMASECFAFCNYFVGTDRFWQAYFDYVEVFLGALEEQRRRGTPVGQFYASSGIYARDTSVTTRPFIIERLFSSFLSTHPELQVAAYPMPPALYAAKFGVRLGETLFHLNTLKNRVRQTNDQATFDQWQALRSELMPLAMEHIWPLDDPIEQMMSPRFRPSLAAAGPSPAGLAG